MRALSFGAVVALLVGCPKVASAPKSASKSEPNSAVQPAPEAPSDAPAFDPLPDDPVARVDAAKEILAQEDPPEMKSYSIELESEDRLYIYVLRGDRVRFELESFTDDVETYEEEDTIMAEGERRTLVRSWHFRNRELFAVTDDLEVMTHEGAEGTISCLTTDLLMTYYVQGSQLLGTTTFDETSEWCQNDESEAEPDPIAVDSEIRPRDSPIGAQLAKEGALLLRISDGDAPPKFELGEIENR